MSGCIAESYNGQTFGSTNVAEQPQSHE